MIRPRYNATSSSRSGSYGGSSGGSSDCNTDCNTNDTSYSADSASSASAAATPSSSRNGSFDAAMAGGDDGQKQQQQQQKQKQMADDNTQAATDEKDLIQLVYTSSAKDRYMSRKEIEQILMYSRQSNTADSITGLLLYRDGSFAQFLEGPAAAVNATFHRIQADPRHRGVIVLLNRSVERRDFQGWRMAYRDLDLDLDESNMDEQAGQVGARSEKKRPPQPPTATTTAAAAAAAGTEASSAAGVDDVDDVKEARSCMIDLQKTGREQLAHSKMSSSIRTLIRVFHSSMGGRQ